MYALKGLVVGLGVLIVISFGLLIYGFMTKIATPSPQMAADDAAPAVAVPLAGFGEERLSLPPECVVEEMRPNGRRLYLRLGPSGVCDRIVILDSTSGRQVGVVTIRP